MKSFEYTITDPVGIHARPAGILVQKIREQSGTSVFISKGEKSVNALKLMALMQMGIKQGDTITVSIEGENEEQVATDLEVFFKENF